MVGRLAAKISDVIFDQCIEWMTGGSKEQIGAAMDRYTKKKKYEKYRISLDEEILKKFGDEAFIMNSAMPCCAPGIWTGLSADVWIEVLLMARRMESSCVRFSRSVIWDRAKCREPGNV